MLSQLLFQMRPNPVVLTFVSPVTVAVSIADSVHDHMYMGVVRILVHRIEDLIILGIIICQRIRDLHNARLRDLFLGRKAQDSVLKAGLAVFIKNVRHGFHLFRSVVRIQIPPAD